MLFLPQKNRPQGAVFSLSVFTDFGLAAEIRPQLDRNINRTVRILVIFNKRNQSAGRCDAGIVQCMNIFNFAVGIVAIAQIRPAGLPISDVGAGMGFTITVLRRNPGLQVILTIFRRTHITGADIKNLIRKLQILQNFFGDRQKLFMPLVTFVDVIFADDKLLGFHKLVNPHQTAGVFSGGSGFTTETGRKSGIENRQFVLAENFIGTQGIQNQFGCSRKI